jgi:hypothetical protein
MGLVRPRLLEWQWSDYSQKHQDRTNLLLHIFAVPLFEIAVIVLIAGLATASGPALGLAVVGMVVAVVIQGRGHRREREAPTPFAGPIDFVSRFFAEQWITFPRFVLSGGWVRNLSASGD